MTLEKICSRLSKDNQYHLAIQLNQIALKNWDDYVKDNVLEYKDSIAGAKHKVPQTLLIDTIDEVKKFVSKPKLYRWFKTDIKLYKLYAYFDDPIVALQDEDWVLPKNVELTFYSTYNLLGSIVDDKINNSGNSTIYVSINQSIKAIEMSNQLTEIEIRTILEKAKNGM